MRKSTLPTQYGCCFSLLSCSSLVFLFLSLVQLEEGEIDERLQSFKKCVVQSEGRKKPGGAMIEETFDDETDNDESQDQES